MGLVLEIHSSVTLPHTTPSGHRVAVLAQCSVPASVSVQADESAQLGPSATPFSNIMSNTISEQARSADSEEFLTPLPSQMWGLSRSAHKVPQLPLPLGNVDHPQSYVYPFSGSSAVETQTPRTFISSRSTQSRSSKWHFLSTLDKDFYSSLSFGRKSIWRSVRRQPERSSRRSSCRASQVKVVHPPVPSSQSS